MSLETGTAARLRFASQWQGLARLMMFGAMGSIFVAAVIGKFWLAVVGVAAAFPAAWIFNLQCRECSWLVYRAFGSASPKYQLDQLFAPLFSKILWKLPTACTKCGADFSGNEPMESQ